MAGFLFALLLLAPADAATDWKPETFRIPPDPDPVLYGERFRLAPSPVPEEAAIRLMPSLPDAAARRRFVEENFPDLALFGGTHGTSRAVRWLTADSCLLPFRLALWLEYVTQLPPADQSWGFEILWDALPGHPQSHDFLQGALTAARQAGKEPEARRLEKILHHFWPADFPEETRRALRADIPCRRRTAFLQIALGTGEAGIVLESVAECPDPYWQALALHRLESYAQAWRAWQEVPPSRRTDSLENRLAGMALSPARLIERYRLLYARDPSPAALRRYIRTLLQFGRVEEAGMALSLNSDPAWRFWRGLSAWMSGKRTEALAQWAAASPGETAEERTTRLYWLARAGGPDELPRHLDVQKPVLAYYRHMRRLQRNTAGDGVTRPLPVILRPQKATDEGFFSRAAASRSWPTAAATLALRPHDDAHRTDACLMDLASAARAHYRSQLDLWKCPHFLEGRPQLCPESPRPSPLPPGLRIDSDFPPARMEGGLMPQPYEKWIQQAAADFRLPKSLLWAIMQTESSFFPRVISGAGAVGLFQVIPPTGNFIARALGTQPFHAAQLLEPETAVRFGAWYLRHLADAFGENWLLVAAAYNAGPHQVRRWLERPAAWPSDAWVETIPFEETRRYVKLVIGRMVLFARQVGEPPPKLPSEIPNAPEQTDP